MPYCARCGNRIRSDDQIKFSSRYSELLSKYSVPEFEIICGSCWYYYINYFKDKGYKDHRDYIDSLWKDGNQCGRASRLNPRCREFDEKYGFINSKTGLFFENSFDEDEEDSCIDYQIEHYGSSSGISKEELRFNYFGNELKTIFDTELRQKSTMACYESLKEDVINSYETSFATSLQNYITRLGLIFSKEASLKFNGKNHYVEVLAYLCITILDDFDLYIQLVQINQFANQAKHSTKNINLNINKYLAIYNYMIEKLNYILGYKTNSENKGPFEICHIYNRNTLSEVVCTCCGRINPEKYYRCPECKEIVCEDCYDKQEKMCDNCFEQLDSDEDDDTYYDDDEENNNYTDDYEDDDGYDEDFGEDDYDEDGDIENEEICFDDDNDEDGHSLFQELKKERNGTRLVPWICGLSQNERNIVKEFLTEEEKKDCDFYWKTRKELKDEKDYCTHKGYIDYLKNWYTNNKYQYAFNILLDLKYDFKCISESELEEIRKSR